MADGTPVIPAFVPARHVVEHNSLRHGLISVMSKLPVAHRMKWESKRGDEQTYGLTKCTATNDAGVPHGIAYDVYAALITQAVIQREGGLSTEELVMTAKDIAQHCVFDLHDRHYLQIDQALRSLSGSVFHIEKQWYNIFTKKQEGAEFKLIDSLSWQISEHPFNPAQNTRIYRIRMAKEITNSVNGGLVLALNPTILHHLGHPTSRGMFRMLEGQRRDSNNITVVKPTLTIRVQDLADAARYMAARSEAANLNRLMTPTFKALESIHYLTSVVPKGRGDAMTLTFNFSNDGQAINPRAFDLLTAEGISEDTAVNLAMAHDIKIIESVMAMRDEKVVKDSKIYNPTGLLISMLKDKSTLDKVPAHQEKTRLKAIASARQKKIQDEPVASLENFPEKIRKGNEMIIGLWLGKGLINETEAKFLRSRNIDGHFDEHNLSSIQFRLAADKDEAQLKEQIVLALTLS